MSTQRIIVYARPWNNDQFRHLVAQAWPDASQLAMSEHRGVDKSGYFDAFYAALRDPRIAVGSEALTEAVVEDVIVRCRLLRSIEKSKAVHLVRATEAASRQVLDQFRPDAVLSQSIDSYIMHVLYLLARQRGIVFIGMMPTFVSNHFRITALGEHSRVRSAANDEVEKIVNMLSKDSYKPDFMTGLTNASRKRAVRNWARRLPKPLYFWLRRKVTGDPYNFHDYSTQLVSQQYWSLLPRLCPETQDVEALLKRLRAEGLPLIFLPLQMSPEATVDYWAQNSDWAHYEAQILKTISDYAGRAHFLIKEHPAVVGSRTSSFYNSLQSMANCSIVPADLNSNIVMGFSDGVLICTGTIGFEALLRGKSVYSDAKPYYAPDGWIEPLERIGAPKGEQPTGDMKTGLVRYLLEGLVPGRFINDGSWNGEDPAHIDANKTVAEGVRDVFPRLAASQK